MAFFSFNPVKKITASSCPSIFEDRKADGNAKRGLKSSCGKLAGRKKWFLSTNEAARAIIVSFG